MITIGCGKCGHYYQVENFMEGVCEKCGYSVAEDCGMNDDDSDCSSEEMCEYCETTEDLCDCVKCYGCGKNITEEYEDWFDEHADDEWRAPECECEKCDRLVSYGCSTSTDTMKFLLTQGWKRDDEYIHQLVRAN